MRILQLLVLLGVLGSCAGRQPAAPVPPSPVAQVAPTTAPSIPAVNEPDNIGLGTARIIGTSRGYANVAVIPLAPDHVGLTVSSQPVLYWYLSRPIMSQVMFVLIDTRTVKVTHDVRMTPPFQPGLHAISFNSFGMFLEPNVQYRWYIAVVVDERAPSRDIVSGGMIRRIEPDVQVASFARIDPKHVVRAYAEAGLWYDALAAISHQISATPTDRRLRMQRASLLRQIGLQEVADWDLQDAHGLN